MFLHRGIESTFYICSSKIAWRAFKHVLLLLNLNTKVCFAIEQLFLEENLHCTAELGGAGLPGLLEFLTTSFVPVKTHSYSTKGEKILLVHIFMGSIVLSFS